MYFPTKSLFALYLIISGNFLASLFGCRIQDLMTNNMYVKHFLGFMTLYFFVILTESDKAIGSYGATQKMLLALGLYVWFLLSSRMNYKLWFAFIVLLGAVYILEIYKEEEYIDPDTKILLRKIQEALLGVAILLTAVGFIAYLGEKKYEYGKGFQYDKFFVGKPHCAGDQLGGKKPLHFMQYLQYAFH